MSSGWKQKRFTVFFMFSITFVFISIVTAVHMATQSTVERNKTLFLKQAVCDASGMPKPENADALIAWYDANVTAYDASGSLLEKEAKATDHFRVRSADALGTEAFVVISRGPGLWGQITAFVGFTPDGTRIKAVTFLEHMETPGLGARIDESWFKQQFIGKKGPFTALTPEPKDKTRASDADANTFDQITGATITSTAVRNIMNDSLERAQLLTTTPAKN